MAIKNFSTSVDIWKTIGEIQLALSKAGATHINIRNDSGRPIGIMFCFEYGPEKTPVNFSLPCDPSEVLEALRELNKEQQRTMKRKGADTIEEQAARTTWRIVKDWIEAQIAFIEARRAKDRAQALITVFLPYATNGDGVTLAEKILSGGGDQLKKIGF